MRKASIKTFLATKLAEVPMKPVLTGGRYGSFDIEAGLRSFYGEIKCVNGSHFEIVVGPDMNSMTGHRYSISVNLNGRDFQCRNMNAREVLQILHNYTVNSFSLGAPRYFTEA